MPKYAGQSQSDSLGSHAAPIVIDFAQGGNGLGLRGDGWSGQEPTHIWTVGPRSTLHVPPLRSGVEYRVTLDVAACLRPPHVVAGQLGVSVSGVNLGSFSLGLRQQVQFNLPGELVPENGRLTLVFDHPDFVRLADLGDPDTRELAMAFRRIEFDPVDEVEFASSQAEYEEGEHISSHLVADNETQHPENPADDLVHAGSDAGFQTTDAGQRGLHEWFAANPVLDQLRTRLRTMGKRFSSFRPHDR